MGPTMVIDYPTSFFQITQSDMDRIARRIEQTGLARDLTALGRRFVRGRLRYGTERDDPLPVVVKPRDQVRIWDPSGAWHAGDYAITAVPAVRERFRTFLPTIGEVIVVRGNGATVRVDGAGAPRVYGLPGREHRDASLDAWRDSIEATVAALRQRNDEDSRIDYILWAHGEKVWSSLLGALRHDARFVALNGEWFLRSLVVTPSKPELEGLARFMLQATAGPWSVTDLLPRCGAAGSTGIAGLFGLALALQERPDLFRNISPGAAPRWILAGPPPGHYVARQAAYDPETYELLCEPGDRLSEDVIDRLWALDLLTVVV